MFNEKPVSITIHKEKCTNCKKCEAICPVTRVFGIQSLEGEDAAKMCIKCGNCMAICPTGAITIEDLLVPNPSGEIPSGELTLNLIKNRRSVRTFKDQKIKKEDWEKLIEAVQYSPTGHNNQFVDIVIVESPELLKQISEIGMKVLEKMGSRLNHPIHKIILRRVLGDHSASVFGKAYCYLENQREMISQGEDPILFNAPALMLFIAPKSELMSKNDADLAAQSVALLAPALGLGTCYSGIVSAAYSGVYPDIKKLIPLPKGYSVFNSIIIGYPKYRYPFVSPRKNRNVTYL